MFLYFLFALNFLFHTAFSVVHEPVNLALDTSYKKPEILSCAQEFRFSRVSIKGFLWGKDIYKTYYLLRSGEYFEKEKHDLSLQKIKKILKDDGYFSAQIEDKLSWDKKSKSVSIEIKINKGPRFKIGETEFVVHDNSTDNPDVRKLIERNVNNLILNKYYKKESLDNAGQIIKKTVLQEGFVNCNLGVSEHVNYPASNIKLIFTLDLRSHKKYIFQGNKAFAAQELLQHLSQMGSSIIFLPPNFIAEELESLYKSKGFVDTKIVWKEDKDSLVFTIDESDRCKINQIILENLTVYDAKITQQEFTSILENSFYDPVILNQIIDKLKQKYHSIGYLQIAIGEPRFLKLDNGSFNIILKLHEGRQYFLKSIKFEGLENLEKHEPFASWQTQNFPKVFDLSLIQQQQDIINKYLQDNSYFYARVEPEFKADQENIALIWHITGNKLQVKFGKTILNGACSLSSDILLRELEYQEGDLWNSKKIEKSLANLKKLRIFETISLSPAQVLKQESSMPMELNFLTIQPFELSTRAGFQQVSRNFAFKSGSTYKFGATFIWHNPRQCADHFTIDADVNRFKRSLSADYQVPWIYNRRVITTFKGYTIFYEQPIVIGCQYPLYTSIQNGFLVNGRVSRNCYETGINIGIEWLKLENIRRSLATVLHFEPSLIDKAQPVFYIEPVIMGYFTDHETNPTRGTTLMCTLKGVVPMSKTSESFLKIIYDQSFYYPFTSSVIGALHTRIGNIFTGHFKRISPIERFYLGGAYSLRGYEPDFAPPLGCYEPKIGCKELVPIGGQSVASLNAELRFPVYNQINGTVFTDMGVLKTDTRAAFSMTSGFGVRYNTPLGPFRFDIGWKWFKANCLERRYAWYLTLGHAF